MIEWEAYGSEMLLITFPIIIGLPSFLIQKITLIGNEDQGGIYTVMLIPFYSSLFDMANRKL